KRRVAVERLLLRHRAVEGLLPRDERAEHRRVLQVALAHDRPRRHLRHRLLHEVAELRERLVVVIRLAGVREERQPRRRPAAGLPVASVIPRRSSPSSSLTPYIPPELRMISTAPRPTSARPRTPPTSSSRLALRHASGRP